MTVARASFCGVVFDFDGTLLDSMPLVLEGMAMAVSPYRPKPAPTEVMASLGGPSEACLRRLLGGPMHLADALATYQRYFEGHEEMTRLFPGARELLRDLHAAGIRLALWTGRERSLTMRRLRDLGLDHVFAPVVCGDDLTSHKPDPEGLLQVFSRWGTAPAEGLFVGDSDQDLQAAKSAGVPLVAIRHGRAIDPELLAHPVLVAETPPEAYAWLRGTLLGAG